MIPVYKSLANIIFVVQEGAGLEDVCGIARYSFGGFRAAAGLEIIWGQ